MIKQTGDAWDQKLDSWVLESPGRSFEWMHHLEESGPFITLSLITTDENYTSRMTRYVMPLDHFIDYSLRETMINEAIRLWTVRVGV